MQQAELAGALNQRVAVETWQEFRDDAGGVAGHWAIGTSVFAAVVPDGGGAAVVGEALRTRQRWRVVVRKPAVAIGITSRLIWQGRVLAILSVEDDPRRPDRLLLRCESRP